VVVQSAGIRELVVLKGVGPLDHFVDIDVAEGEAVGRGLDLRAGTSLSSLCAHDGRANRGDLEGGLRLGR